MIIHLQIEFPEPSLAKLCLYLVVNDSEVSRDACGSRSVAVQLLLDLVKFADEDIFLWGSTEECEWPSPGAPNRSRVLQIASRSRSARCRSSRVSRDASGASRVAYTAPCTPAPHRLALVSMRERMLARGIQTDPRGVSSFTRSLNSVRRSIVN